MARRRPLLHGLGFGALVAAVEALGVLGLGGLPRLIGTDLIGVVLGSAWAWAVFGGWVGRGARTPLRATIMAAVGLAAAALVVNLSAGVIELTRGVDPEEVLERFVPSLGFWLGGPLLLGVVAGLLGWLTRRRDQVGAAAKIVLALGLSGNMALGLAEGTRGQSSLRTTTAAVAMAVGIAAAIWFAYEAVRRSSDHGPAAAWGTPETPIRRYGIAGGRGSTVYAPDPTRPLPASPYDEATERFPATPRTPGDPDSASDLPTRPNPLRRW